MRASLCGCGSRRRPEESLSPCRPSPTPPSSMPTSWALSLPAGGSRRSRSAMSPTGGPRRLRRAAHFGHRFDRTRSPLLTGLRRLFQQQQAPAQVAGVVRPRRIVSNGMHAEGRKSYGLGRNAALPQGQPHGYAHCCHLPLALVGKRGQGRPGSGEAAPWVLRLREGVAVRL